MDTEVKIDLEKLATEGRNPASANIDKVSTLELVQIINNEDKKVALAVEKILPQIAQAIDIIAERLGQGGRLFYMGAGTSGRLGILDAVECPPTYNTDPELVQGLIAGGIPAIFKAQEGAEDSRELGKADLQAAKLAPQDIVVGIAASGRTPYVIGGLEYAGQVGAATLALACTPQAELAKYAQIALLPIVGPEVVTGSTRMKAGTAQKLVLNMLSTGAMIRLGKVMGNLMVDVKASNLKLQERARRIVMEAVGCTREQAVAALEANNSSCKAAILSLLQEEK